MWVCVDHESAVFWFRLDYSIMASAEEDFPRGGTAKTTQVTKPEKSRVEVDNLFEVKCS